MDYIIGDVQGCYDTLQKLLKKINFREDRDRLFFLGDVVNRGKKSLETLRFIYSLKENANVVLGNHDFHLLVCTLTPKKPNLKDTFSDILNAPDKHTLIDYLLSRSLILEHQDALLVHAGIPPQWGISDALQNADLVHQQLQTNNPSKFLSKMYDNKPSYNGELEFNHKMNIDQAPFGFKAWFLHVDRKLKNKDIFFGHWSTLKGFKIKHVYPMDHGCIWGEKLSAFCTEDRTLISQKSIEDI